MSTYICLSSVVTPWTTTVRRRGETLEERPRIHRYQEVATVNLPLSRRPLHVCEWSSWLHCRAETCRFHSCRLSLQPKPPGGLERLSDGFRRECIRFLSQNPIKVIEVDLLMVACMFSMWSCHRWHVNLSSHSLAGCGGASLNDALPWNLPITTSTQRRIPTTQRVS